ncbi:MAG: type II toxin-antitoxin system VapC family toxin [Leptolyngbyaceae cyanobacterium CRU_2_3]|nr:type II toxin-antitoxin system VapC family toxin [Leptolyngbyaceae cyanobacterium CRU_2_3]
MKLVFADTFYWVALINPGDDWHKSVLSVSRSLDQTKIVTTEEVLTEVLTFYAESSSSMRRRTVAFVDSILKNSGIQVVEQTHQSFQNGLALYRQRLDKGYSLTDCISMHTMRQLEIAGILTHDKHFTQEGFSIAFKD